MTGDADNTDPWTQLTWNDLEHWLGAKILGRSQSYQRRGKVIALARTEERTLTALVSGTEIYHTRVKLDSHEPTPGLSYTCTCPYWAPCKHAGALVLSYVEKVRQEEEIPAELSGTADSLRDAVPEEEDEQLSATTLSGTERERLRADYLDGMSRDELVGLIDDLTAASSEARELLLSRALLSRGATVQITRAAREELQRATNEPDWHSDEWDSPDYHRLKSPAGKAA